MNMRRIYRIVFFVFSFITATFLFACASDEELLAVNDVKDELLVCDLGSFADSVGGTVIGDWRRTGGEGVEVSATEEGLDVTYSFTRESSSNNSDVLCRLDFTKTLSVELDSGDILHVSISECYNATTQSASSLSVEYRISANALDGEAGGLSAVSLDGSEARELLEADGLSQTVERLIGSPMDFFIDSYVCFSEQGS